MRHRWIRGHKVAIEVLTSAALALYGSLSWGADARAVGLQVVITSAVSTITDDDRSNEQFEGLVAEITKEFFGISPELATFYGVDGSLAGEGTSVRLSNYGSQGIEEARDATIGIYRRLVDFDPDNLNDANKLTHDILLSEFGAIVEASQVVDYGRLSPGLFTVYQLDQFIGAHTLLLRLMTVAQPVTNRNEARDYVARLEKIPTALDELYEALEWDVKKGVVPPDFALERLVESIDIIISSEVGDHPLVSTFVEKLKAAELSKHHVFVADVERIVKERIYPAYRRLAHRLREMAVEAPHDAGIWRLPNGDKLYETVIWQQANTRMSADEIHALGLSEVDRITAEMDAILIQENLGEGSVANRMLALAEDEMFLFPNTDQGKAEIVGILNNQISEIDDKLAEWFATLPEYPVEVRRVPAYQEATSASAAYDAASMDGLRPAIYWINLRDTAMVPIWSVKSDTYHETSPGHHLQTSIAQQQASIPMIRQLFSSSPYREGWALYAEHLAKEMGMYEDDPYGDLGRLRWELHRAVRLVVDTGIHAKRWSREKAIEYSVKRGGMDPASAAQEIERYAVLPGQALSYKIGMLKIIELREKARSELNDIFDIRLFHDAVLLAGPVPLGILEKRVDNWIASQLAE